jgi:aromatic ring hydroxylase
LAKLRTGDDYRRALRDGRRVWVAGAGEVADVTTHPATRAMVDEYAAWYDRHGDPAWRDKLLMPADANGDAGGERRPWGYRAPRTADDLVAMGRGFSQVAFLSAGNITHTPAYGHMIAMGVLAYVQDCDFSAVQIANAEAYRQSIARTGRFLTFSSGAPTIGARLDPDPAKRAALRIVRETDTGLVLTGKVGMHTSPAYAEDIYIGSLCGVAYEGRAASFVVPVNAPGVRVICRKVATRDDNPFVAPLSARYDELDGQLWLDEVHVPFERVFLVEASPDPVARWLFWHQLYCWLAKAEFTLGLALACTHALSLSSDEGTLGYLMDLMTDVQTVRACQTAAERDPHFTKSGLCFPNPSHLAAGSIAMLKARPRMSEILRIVPGSSLIMAPVDTDLAASEVAAGLEASFGGGGYTALQRSALLQMAWDHVSSALDGRESVYELHANGGVPTWRQRLRRSFEDYNELANGVLKQLSVPMPAIDLSAIKAAPMTRRRVVEAKPKNS